MPSLLFQRPRIIGRQRVVKRYIVFVPSRFPTGVAARKCAIPTYAVDNETIAFFAIPQRLAVERISWSGVQRISERRRKAAMPTLILKYRRRRSGCICL